MTEQEIIENSIISYFRKNPTKVNEPDVCVRILFTHPISRSICMVDEFYSNSRYANYREAIRRVQKVVSDTDRFYETTNSNNIPIR